MHYYLADQAAAAIDPAARAILLDHDGFVSEATTANVVLVDRDEGLVSPPAEKILPGISLDSLRELAAELGLPQVHRDIRPTELLAADEVLLTSTTVCLLPVVSIDGRPIGDGKPGHVYRQMLAAWSRLVEMDIQDQARRFATR